MSAYPVELETCDIPPFPAGMGIGHGAGRPVPTLHDNCVLILPSIALRKDEIAVRLGRVVGG